MRPEPPLPRGRIGEVTRRLALAAPLCLLASPAWAAGEFAALERRSGGRLGLSAVNLATGQRLAHRADERFAMCSTFKLLLAAAVLARVDAGGESLDRRIRVQRADMLDYAPRTSMRVGATVSVEELCAAAVEVSDNPAANLLLATLGGPGGLTRWLRGLGDATTRLDRNEPALNEATPGDARDTTTPAAMTATMGKLLVGRVLRPASRDRLIVWMIASPTGAKRLRAAGPAGWRAGDKTGTGARGATNDCAIFWPPRGGPILVAAYISDTKADLEARESVHAEAGRLVMRALGPTSA